MIHHCTLALMQYQPPPPPHTHPHTHLHTPTPTHPHTHTSQAHIAIMCTTLLFTIVGIVLIVVHSGGTWLTTTVRN